MALRNLSARIVRSSAGAYQRGTSICASPSYLARRAYAATEPSEPHVLFLSGPDKTGIVAGLAKTVADLGGNMEASRSTVLGDDFSMIALCTLEASKLNSLKAALEKDLAGYYFYTKKTTAKKAAKVTESAAGAQRYVLNIEGADSKGIVASVTEKLARSGVSIINMETDVTTAPFAGFDLFVMKVKFATTKESLEKLQKDLKSVEDKFGLTTSVDKVAK
mmetsp:Transcript_11230/g.19174  ORF Transcript_11230/g.19174 Transcript_11230/m.19174 type:complete len:220 (-) Transcript_11230:264-923(-)|eukprot:CAMPEP_0184691416 /NCGR_PEP_ID=MMETSP0313-20130426/281_1 /TAXON_ID=2792 /ORGANISM="Porphyridium aerugineum, Strain SAG 1380-2" /LENGTH=219 /DNA_ID=CAMNT_0027149127 /DNA_START=72 /DNA_END=731 /DNA_ORIENTATION=+